MIPDPSPPFEFDPSQLIRERIDELVDAATTIGRRTEAILAFAEIFRLLTIEPRDWGDPIRNHHGMKLTEYHGHHWNLRCKYAVHDRVPIVFLLEITVLESNPLFGL
jgi:hypothetical protein